MEAAPYIDVKIVPHSSSHIRTVDHNCWLAARSWHGRSGTGQGGPLWVHYTTHRRTFYTCLVVTFRLEVDRFES